MGGSSENLTRLLCSAPQHEAFRHDVTVFVFFKDALHVCTALLVLSSVSSIPFVSITVVVKSPYSTTGRPLHSVTNLPFIVVPLK